MTEDGRLRPYAYGMPGRHDLGTIAKTGEAVERFRDGGAARIHALIDHAFSGCPQKAGWTGMRI
ncbi:hypothetical protein ACU635_31080 [[Actinomadura] parvosata]|uniref:hypothetical protein n=1 Tax=[Actinomadura] parvosata TaxID=1955412 RepID=UPI00406C8DEC